MQASRPLTQQELPNIADGLEKGAEAMMMYYEDNSDEIAVKGVGGAGVLALADVLAGAQAYLKNSDQLVTTPAAGKYSISIVGTAPDQEWWIVYTLPANDLAGVGPIMKNKARRMKLMKEVPTAVGAADALYEGDAVTIAMKVR